MHMFAYFELSETASDSANLRLSVEDCHLHVTYSTCHDLNKSVAWRVRSSGMQMKGAEDLFCTLPFELSSISARATIYQNLVTLVSCRSNLQTRIEEDEQQY